MEELQVFDNSSFGRIRSVVINDQPWFAGKDVAKVLGYTNTQKAIRDHVDSDDRMTSDLFTTSGTSIAVINESGLYSLIMTSKLPAAKDFRRWVTSEVLPALRRSGSYTTPEAQDGDSPVPVRTLTSDDYLAAARLIASCKADRLTIVLKLLSKGGWELGEARTSITAPVSTADIGSRLRAAKENYHMTWTQLAAELHMDAAIIRAYGTGHRYPKADRYAHMVNALIDLELRMEESLEDVEDQEDPEQEGESDQKR
jgi:prophage antirepressor-like protein